MAVIIKHLRAQYYEAPIPVQGLRQYHLSEQEIAGLWGTETCHPPLFNIPRHAHDLASFYLVLEGSLTEFYDRNQLATKLYKEFRYVDKASALAVEGLALEILAAFARQTENAPAAYLPGWLRAAKDLLHDRFSETIRLNEIAEQVGVHPVHLARAFRKRYGCSLGEYQRRLRVEHASRQLAATKSTLADIALAAGFADQAHFSRVFKERTGLTPAKFRATFALS